MAKKITKPKQSIRLKARVEDFLSSNLSAIKRIPAADVRNLFEDLQIYQNELENHSKEMQESEEKFRNLFETSVDGIMVIDAETTMIIDVNEACEKIYGYSKEEFSKLKLTDVSNEPAKSKSAIKPTMDGSLTKIPIRYHKKKDGSVFPLEVTVGTFSLMGKKVVYGVLRDITDRIQAEKALKESEAKYRLLADNVKDVIYIVNPDNLKVEYVSPSIKSILGYTVEEFMASNVYDLLLPYSADLVMETIAQELDKEKYGKAKPQLLELEIIHKDGLKICVGVSARFLRDNEGNVTSILCVARDISERKKAEDALKESEERYRRLTANAKDMIYRQSLLDGRYEYVNQASVEITGYTPEEICNEPLHIRKTVHPDWKDYVDEQWEKLLKGEVPPYYEFQIVHKSGHVKWLHQRNVIIYDDNEQPIATEGIATDITELKQAEESLQKSEKMHRLLAENARDTIFRQSLPGGEFEYISSAFKSLTGYKPEELYNEPLLMMREIVHSDSADCFKDQWEKLLDGEISPYYEYKVVSRSGEIKWVNQRSVLIIDNNTNRPIAVEGIISDVTEQKQLAEVLRESEVKHKTLVNNIPGMIYRADHDWSAEVVSGSDAICGYTKEELSSKDNNWLSIIHPDDKKKVFADGSEFAQTQKNIVQTYRIKTKDGDIRWVEDRKRSIFSEKGEFVGIDGVVFDITDRKQAEEDLARANERLEEKVKERTAEIEEKGVALKVLLDQRGGDKKKLEESIMSNVKELVIPNIKRLKSSTLTSKQQTALTILEANLNELISPFANSASSIFMKLTPTEIQVANFIKNGASSKDIAESLSLSQRTVDTHRYNIRKKLGVSGKGTNLRTYLLSMA